MTRGWFVGWSTFVGILWVGLAASVADDETCSWICFTFGDMFFPAAFVLAIGLIVMYIVGRLRRRGSSSDAGATTGTH